MSALDHASLLQQLVIAGEMVIQMRSSRGADALASLAEQVNAEYHKPADGVRVIDVDAIIFINALLGAASEIAGYHRERAAKYVRVIGVLLPDIRERLSTAIELRNRPTP
jgi:hypothetical protein